MDGDRAGQVAMAAKAGGRSTVPQIFIGDRHVGGCDDLYSLEAAGELDTLLAGRTMINLRSAASRGLVRKLVSRQRGV